VTFTRISLLSPWGAHGPGHLGTEGLARRRTTIVLWRAGCATILCPRLAVMGNLAKELPLTITDGAPWLWVRATLLRWGPTRRAADSTRRASSNWKLNETRSRRTSRMGAMQTAWRGHEFVLDLSSMLMPSRGHGTLQLGVKDEPAHVVPCRSPFSRGYGGCRSRRGCTWASRGATGPGNRCWRRWIVAPYSNPASNCTSVASLPRCTQPNGPALQSIAVQRIAVKRCNAATH